jgi:hypothetical protein
MCRKILLMIAFLLPFGVFAQDEEQQHKFLTPDYASIKQMTQDPNSIFYYPKIFKKYMENDTTLSLRDYRMLYYGYVFQDGYSRDGMKTSEDDSIKQIFDKGELTQQDLKDIIRLGIAYLHKVPFDLKRLNLVFVAAKESGDEATAQLYLSKVRMLALTVLTSGNGLSEETPFFVISKSDENAMINILGYKPNGTYDLRTTRYLTVEDNDDNLPGLYFDMKNVTAYTK